jgi:hypothetical protein
LGSLEQPGGGGGVSRDFRKRSIADIKIISSKINKKIVYFLKFIFINSNLLYTKPVKVRGRLRLVLGSETAAAQPRTRRLGRTLMGGSALDLSG